MLSHSNQKTGQNNCDKAGALVLETNSVCQSQLTNSLLAYRLANLLEWRDVKVLGTCLFQTGKLQAQITRNRRDIVGRYLRFVNQLPNLPHVHHLGSVKRGFLPRKTLYSRRNTETKPWTLESKLFFTSLSRQEAQTHHQTDRKGYYGKWPWKRHQNCVKQHWSCSFFSN